MCEVRSSSSKTGDSFSDRQKLWGEEMTPLPIFVQGKGGQHLEFHSWNPTLEQNVITTSLDGLLKLRAPPSLSISPSFPARSSFSLAHLLRCSPQTGFINNLVATALDGGRISQPARSRLVGINNRLHCAVLPFFLFSFKRNHSEKRASP